jgi:signal transduction histidine kinase
MKVPEEHSLAEKYAALEKELALKSREIEIQSALEKVRVVALAMLQPDDMLDVCRTICEQLTLLGVREIRNIQTAIIYESRGIYMNYEYYRLYHKTFITPVQYGHPVQADFVKRMLVEGSYYTVTLVGDELNEWFNYQKTTNQFIDTHLEEAGSLYYHWFSIGPVALGISLYKQISDDGLALFRRFLDVFMLAYRRYHDVEQAIAQARQARIETALEKVRSRSLAMRKTGELSEVVAVVFEKLHDLGLPFHSAALVELIEGSKDAVHWIATAEKIYPTPFFVPANDVFYSDFWNAWQSGEDLFIHTSTLEEKNAAWKWAFENSDYKTLPDDRKAFILESKSYGLAAAISKNSAIIIGSFSGQMLAEPDVDLIKRLGRVFEQAYVRFLDLQNAEAQAREAQIQLGLERVRARAMAMQHSDELLETSGLLSQQFYDLGTNAQQISIGIVNEQRGMVELSATVRGVPLPQVFDVRMDQPMVMGPACKAWKEGKKSLEIILRGEQLNEYNKLRNRESGGKFDSDEKGPDAQWIANIVAFSQGFLACSTDSPVTPETRELLARFAKVFEQTYTRFLDLKNAEAQAREAKIEVALEKVRARAMSMHKSQDINNAVLAVFEELEKLALDILRCGIGIIDKENHVGDIWTTVKLDGKSSVQVSGKEPMQIHPLLAGTFDAWVNQTDFSYELEGSDLIDYYRAVSGTNFTLPESHIITNEKPGAKQYYYTATFKTGNLYAFRESEFSEDAKKIMKRLTSALNLTFSRFLDLQKAEAQAREAQIEASLERVRSKTMAMHNSLDVGETIATMFDEFVKLGIETLRCGILIGNDSKEMEVWTAKSNPDGIATLIVGRLETMIHPMMQGMIVAWKSKERAFEYQLIGDDLKAYYRAINNADFYPAQFDIDSLPASQFHTDFFFRDGAVFAFTAEPLAESAVQVLTRFAGVFGQTYRRFLDLQKAEAQAREAQIENALEKVRSRSLAMHKSDELQEVVTVVFEKLQELDVVREGDSASILLTTEGSKDATHWIATANQSYFKGIYRPHFDHPVNNDFWSAKESGMDLFAKAYTFEEKNSWWTYVFEHSDYKYGPDDRKKLILESKGWALTWAIAKNASIAINSYAVQLLSEKENDILKRFSRVFEQAYVRFLDLKKVEEQSRESQVQLALERVRARSMAMQKSSELAEMIQLIFEQFLFLGLNIDIATFATNLGVDRSQTHWWSASRTTKYPAKQSLPIIDHPLFNNIFNAYDQGLDFVSDRLAFEEKNAIMRHFFTYSPGISEERKQQILAAPGYARSFAVAKNIGLSITNYADIPYTEQENAILRRFCTTFDQTYTRFLDLQNAEAQAREAVKQASVDRVRADIASMRTTADLERITPLIWNELTTLGVPFIRSGVFIVDERAELIHTYLSSPDGNALAAFDVPFSAEGLGREIIPAWRKKQVATVHWTEEEFAASTKNLVDQGALGSGERLVTERPHTSLDLHLLPFLQGMLYVGNSAPLSVGEMDLVQSLADAFSTAYARYEDFNKLEAAKQQVEHTLAELKTTQTQLVQKEKMASLGEMTAGIAHEIQNPLNFVNNFSEVNREMLEELKAETQKPGAERDEQFEIELINDLISNEEKINHHGKRADSIVKGMLQHSRSSGGEKLSTDMNALAEEYFRLSYHGLRAKDKNFNAEMITHFDENLSKIDVVQQDIGRVLLNLFNNAFYAVNEKKKTATPGYKPEVTITTAPQPLPKEPFIPNGGAEVQGIIITVMDNGNGIPDAIKEKIMQPFFTTKPTGEGTGLGLSLSYDIVVKGHGGTIDVETKEGEYTEFILTLPLKNL